MTVAQLKNAILSFDLDDRLIGSKLELRRRCFELNAAYLGYPANENGGASTTTMVQTDAAVPLPLPPLQRMLLMEREKLAMFPEEWGLLTCSCLSFLPCPKQMK